MFSFELAEIQKSSRGSKIQEKHRLLHSFDITQDKSVRNDTKILSRPKRRSLAMTLNHVGFRV